MATTSNANSRISTKPKSKVLLVDDHPILRRGIADLINSENNLEVCGEAGNMQDAFSLATQLKPDLAIIDVSLDGNNGIELMKNLTSRSPNLPLIAYSMHDESIYAERALRAGAKGYVMKQAAPELLLEAISQVLKGKIFLSEAMSDRLLGKLVGAGASAAPTTSPIDKLCLSVKTIETYREHLKQKLNLASGQELLRYAIEWSLNQS